MPQLDVSTFSSQIFWLVIFFLAIYFVVSKIFSPKINIIFHERESKILSGIEDAELTKQQIASFDVEYKAAISQARKNASTIVSAASFEIKKRFEISCADFDQKLKHKFNATEANIDRYIKDSELKVSQIKTAIVSTIMKKFFGIEVKL